MKEEIMQALIAGEEVASEDVLEYINDLKEQVHKETAKEIFDTLIFWAENQKTWGKTIDVDELVDCLKGFSAKHGVEVE